MTSPSSSSVHGDPEGTTEIIEMAGVQMKNFTTFLRGWVDKLRATGTVMDRRRLQTLVECHELLGPLYRDATGEVLPDRPRLDTSIPDELGASLQDRMVRAQAALWTKLLAAPDPRRALVRWLMHLEAVTNGGLTCDRFQRDVLSR